MEDWLPAREEEPIIAPLVRWAKREGGIHTVSASIYRADGSSISQSVQLADELVPNPAGRN